MRVYELLFLMHTLCTLCSADRLRSAPDRPRRDRRRHPSPARTAALLLAHPAVALTAAISSGQTAGPAPLPALARLLEPAPSSRSRSNAVGRVLTWYSLALARFGQPRSSRRPLVDAVVRASICPAHSACATPLARRC